MATYYIALTKESGDWDIIDEFEAESDAAAESYAETNHAGLDWYVLDKDQQNINA